MDAHIFPFYLNHPKVFYIGFNLMLMYGPFLENSNTGNCTYLYLVDLKTNQWLNLDITGAFCGGFVYFEPKSTICTQGGGNDLILINDNIMHIIMSYYRFTKLIIYNINLLNLRNRVNKIEINMQLLNQRRCLTTDYYIVVDYYDPFGTEVNIRPFILNLKKLQNRVLDFATNVGFYNDRGIVKTWVYQQNRTVSYSNFTLYDYVNNKIIYKLNPDNPDNYILDGVLVAYTGDRAMNATIIYTRKKHPDE